MRICLDNNILMQQFDYLIAGVENPMLDIMVYLKDKELYEKYDLAMGSACLAEDKHMPLFEEIWEMEDIQTSAGGSSLNTISSANFLLKQNYPNKCLYFGAIGDDEQGHLL